MSDGVQRRPALGPRVDPTTASIPERRPSPENGGGPSQTVASAPQLTSVSAGTAQGETLNTPLNTRVRTSTRSRLEMAVNKLRYERNDRSISIASLTDQALDSFLRDVGV